MTDDRLNDLLREAQESYRIPAEAPYDAMWERIEREAFDAPRVPAPMSGDAIVLDGARRAAPRRKSWLAPVAGIAATLLVGVGIGRLTAPSRAVGSLPSVVDADATARPAATPDASPASAVSGDVAEPLQRATYEYLARTVALLDSIPGSAAGRPLRSDARFVADASQLLSTTRLLLDSPAARDPRMRDLLEDLELVLAQVSRLRSAPRADELTYIAEAMNERDVVPRLRTVTASYTASGY